VQAIFTFVESDHAQQFGFYQRYDYSHDVVDPGRGVQDVDSLKARRVGVLKTQKT
jgi:hypothetical protein